MKAGLLIAAVATLAAVPALTAGPTDPQIAHIAYTAGQIDIAAGKQALARSHNKAVRTFAAVEGLEAHGRSGELRFE